MSTDFPLPINDDETEESKRVKKLLNKAADASSTIKEARSFYEKALSVAHQHALDFNDAFDLIDEARPEVSARQHATEPANASEPEADEPVEDRGEANEVVAPKADLEDPFDDFAVLFKDIIAREKREQKKLGKFAEELKDARAGLKAGVSFYEGLMRVAEIYAEIDKRNLSWSGYVGKHARKFNADKPFYNLLKELMVGSKPS